MFMNSYYIRPLILFMYSGNLSKSYPLVNLSSTDF